MNRRAFFALFAGAAGTAGAVGLQTAAPATGICIAEVYGTQQLLSELEIRFLARDWADRQIHLARHHPVTVPS